MKIKVTSLCGAAIVGVCTSLACGAAIAQNLALTYQLEPKTDLAPQAPRMIDRCFGSTWAASFGVGCGTPTADATVPLPGESEPLLSANKPAASTEVLPSEATGNQRRDSAESVGGPADAYSVLPVLRSPTPETGPVRIAGSKEALLGNSKTVDLMFRFGTKYRLRTGDEGWDVYKFSDAAYENRVQNNQKAVGVELLFPFH